MGIIFFLSHQPGDLARLPPVVGIDKLLHVIAYGVLAASFLYGVNSSLSENSNNRLITVAAVLFCILFGISDEYHQSFIQGRYASFWDVFFDGIGALLAVGWWSRKQAKE